MKLKASKPLKHNLKIGDRVVSVFYPLGMTKPEREAFIKTCIKESDRIGTIISGPKTREHFNDKVPCIFMVKYDDGHTSETHSDWLEKMESVDQIFKDMLK